MLVDNRRWLTAQVYQHFLKKMHFRRCMIKHSKTQGNALTPERYPYASASQNTAGQEGMLNALVTVCITILWNLKGTQNLMLFVVNSIKLHLTALKFL